MRKQVAGLDGISPSRLVLPLEAHARLAQMLAAFEQQAPWPESVCHWKIVTFPKQRKGVLPTLEEVRPSAIGFAIYRLWGRIRLRHLAATLAQGCIQAGGIGGEDVSSLLLPMGVGLDSASYPCLMALDFQPVKRAVEQSAQLMTFAGTCAKPHGELLSPTGGDPFSDISMSLVLKAAHPGRGL